MARAIPVLMYHRINDQLQDSRDVSVATLDCHMAYLARSGYTTLFAEELVQVLTGAATWPSRPVVVTFDDGTDDLYRDTYPVLAKHGIKAVAFVVTRRAETMEDGYLNWEQMEELVRSGFIDVQSHTHRHRKDNLLLLQAGRKGEIQEDLERSRELIERRLRRACRYLAWPQGHYNAELLGMALEAGYRATFTTRNGANTAAALPALYRFKVKERPERWLATRLGIYSRALPALVYGRLRSKKNRNREREMQL